VFRFWRLFFGFAYLIADFDDLDLFRIVFYFFVDTFSIESQLVLWNNEEFVTDC